ncbi:MAG: phospholipase D-like domain-containing protein, partial [Gammaproteobacteria bacterium]|nr:phospholipase D-like domain-containing protein [Gammaproteobacteria bacterium]
MKFLRIFLLLPAMLVLVACATTGADQVHPLKSTRQLLAEAGTLAGNEEFIRQLRDARTWVPYRRLTEDPIEVGKNAKIPIQHEQVKILGPSREDALRSLALKVWLIEQAQHTVDMVYFIFTQDLVGQALTGALCNAVQRGVDVRVMVDSIGSLNFVRKELMALESCADNAGFMRTIDGQLTPYRARVQVVLFNSPVKTISWANRRSHDKLMVVDGAFPGEAVVMTGGRNVSLSYYGVNADGSENTGTYQDLEVLIKSGAQDGFEEWTVGNTSGIYFSLLFLHENNNRLRPVYYADPDDDSFLEDDPYLPERKRAQQNLARMKSLPGISEMLADMPEYMRTGFRDSQVRLAHEFANLVNDDVITETEANQEDNPNSVMVLLGRLGDSLEPGSALRVVSPYIFVPRYYDKEGNVIEDGALDAHQWLSEHPENRIEVVTNSVLTSDNFLAQSIIDMDVGPRLFLTPEMEEAWLSSLEEGEFNPALVESEEWQRLINHPQLFLYQTGKLDAALLGKGDEHYGKLHAKFLIGGDIGFVGTANFDY